MRLVSKFGRHYLDGGSQAVILTDEIERQLETWFPGALGYFDVRGVELMAYHDGCADRHHNPMTAGPQHLPRPSLPRVEQLRSAVVGCKVLVLVKLPQPIGETWIPAVVVSSPRQVALVDGRILPASASAAAITDSAGTPPAATGLEIAQDGTPWRREKSGTLTRLARFLGDVTTLGALAEQGSGRALVDTGSGWKPVEIA